MAEWVEQDTRRVRLALEDVYMMARTKRAKRHRYDEAGNFVGLVGPKSDDEDWDRVIEFCERAGLRASILRTMTTAKFDAEQVGADE